MLDYFDRPFKCQKHLNKVCMKKLNVHQVKNRMTKECTKKTFWHFWKTRLRVTRRGYMAGTKRSKHDSPGIGSKRPQLKKVAQFRCKIKASLIVFFKCWWIAFYEFTPFGCMVFLRSTIKKLKVARIYSMKELSWILRQDNALAQILFF